MLALIAQHPDRRAGDLAQMLDREKEPFKLDVRKLKNLGLTLSLPVGYRISPRGAAYLRDHDHTSMTGTLTNRLRRGWATAPGSGPAARRRTAAAS